MGTGCASCVHHEPRSGQSQQFCRNTGDHVAQTAVETIIRLSALACEAGHIERRTIWLAELEIVLHQRHVEVVNAGTDGDSNIGGSPVLETFTGPVHLRVRQSLARYRQKKADAAA